MEALTNLYNEQKDKINNLSDVYQTNREKYTQKINDLSTLYEKNREKIVYIKNNASRFTKLILVLLVFLLLIIGIFLVIIGVEGSPNGESSTSLIYRRFFQNFES